MLRVIPRSIMFDTHERVTYLVRDYGVVEVHTWTVQWVEKMLQAQNWAVWAGFLKGLERLGEKADAKLAP